MNINRRGFLLGSAAAATLAGCATNKVGLRELKPGEKLRAAIIGYGIQARTALVPQFLGQGQAAGVEKMLDIVVVCDCDKVRAKPAPSRSTTRAATMRARRSTTSAKSLRTRRSTSSASARPTTGTPTCPSRR